MEGLKGIRSFWHKRAARSDRGSERVKEELAEEMRADGKGNVGTGADD